MVRRRSLARQNDRSSATFGNLWFAFRLPNYQITHYQISHWEHRQPRFQLVGSHQRVIVDAADESRLLTVVRAAMHVLGDTGSELEGAPYGCAIDITVEVDPLTAVVRPRLSAKCLLHPGIEDGLL